MKAFFKRVLVSLSGRSRPDPESVAEPRIVYWRASPTDWRWHLKAANGEVMAQGEGYVSKANVLRGIETVRRAMSIADVMVRD